MRASEKNDKKKGPKWHWAHNDDVSLRRFQWSYEHSLSDTLLEISTVSNWCWENGISQFSALNACLDDRGNNLFENGIFQWFTKMRIVPTYLS